ncbi:SUKH-4 family immunity protein [Paenibacillus polysaccharolyticus]|uniref:SUKH-4 family immunity protein n=1 Tax=Paenibacillus polysaccharolyticus TaxID=582692 RepID=UPI00209CDDA4|nr:SUKH-4 family immunity protein [Paenibacillus polysaccharolyticus]MCP1136957.1 SUKH-4 family immunity protein [Paenibacillus polysaccharolyticus]
MMNFNILEIKEYYDTDVLEYDYAELSLRGISKKNAQFLTQIGVPEQYEDFFFYKLDQFHDKDLTGEQYIQIGHFASYGMRDAYGLYLKSESDILYMNSSLDKSAVYALNKNIETFFLFHLIRSELSAKMRSEGTYNQAHYASELRSYFEQIDPVAMQNVEGYWSHLLEDYEAGL